MAGKTKKRRFGKKLTLFREAVNKLQPSHRTPHVVTVLGVAMGLTEEKITEEIGIATAMFGHLANAARHPAGVRHVNPEDPFLWCDAADCTHAGVKHTHGGS